jgi:hypothetical protein
MIIKLSLPLYPQGKATLYLSSDSHFAVIDSPSSGTCKIIDGITPDGWHINLTSSEVTRRIDESPFNIKRTAS